MYDLLETTVNCPYCGEPIHVLIEDLDEEQNYIEDCQVCCQPIVFDVTPTMDGDPTVSVHREDEPF